MYVISFIKTNYKKNTSIGNDFVANIKKILNHKIFKEQTISTMPLSRVATNWGIKNS